MSDCPFDEGMSPFAKICAENTALKSELASVRADAATYRTLAEGNGNYARLGNEMLKKQDAEIDQLRESLKECFMMLDLTSRHYWGNSEHDHNWAYYLFDKHREARDNLLKRHEWLGEA